MLRLVNPQKISNISRAGKMAEAMISPLVSRPSNNPSNDCLVHEIPSVSIHDISPSTLSRMKTMFPDVTATTSLKSSDLDVDVVVVAVKPQNCVRLFKELKPLLEENKADPVILSICAGVPIRDFAHGLGTDKIVRSMPNTPATIQEGVTVWTPNGGEKWGDIFDERELKLCSKLLGRCGMEVKVEDEKFIDMATSISGSGPAYVFLLIESMVDTAVHMGFPREVAVKLVHQTILGSTLYAKEASHLHPAELRNSVTSPAGTTASAIFELENGGFRTVTSKAVWACYRRSLEMGGRDSNVGPGRRGEVPGGEMEV